MVPDGTPMAPARPMRVEAGANDGIDPTATGDPTPEHQPTAREDASVPAAVWAAAYLQVREREGRLYPDALVARLPDVPASDPLRREWRQRADSASRLVAHLGQLPLPLVVLEVGCGNGWLANRIAGIPGSEVVGLDANEMELGQARRVFGGRPNLRFVLGDVLVVSSPVERPNVIVLASVIQYVPDLPALIRRLEGWLVPSGEIHVLDSPLYRAEELPGARERTRRYYTALGVPAMAEAYRHHDRRAVDEFAADILYRPDALRRRIERRLLGRSRSPFPWIRVRRESGR